MGCIATNYDELLSWLTVIWTLLWWPHSVDLVYFWKWYSSYLCDLFYCYILYICVICFTAIPFLYLCNLARPSMMPIRTTVFLIDLILFQMVTSFFGGVLYPSLNAFFLFLSFLITAKSFDFFQSAMWRWQICLVGT